MPVGVLPVNHRVQMYAQEILTKGQRRIVQTMALIAMHKTLDVRLILVVVAVQFVLPAIHQHPTHQDSIFAQILEHVHI
jgi:hypothetical protein